jgi:hypothetical protein
MENVRQEFFDYFYGEYNITTLESDFIEIDLILQKKYINELQSLRDQLAAKEKDNVELREAVKDLLPIAHARYCDLDDCEWEKEILYKASIDKARDLINDNKRRNKPNRVGSFNRSGSNHQKG